MSDRAVPEARVFSSVSVVVSVVAYPTRRDSAAVATEKMLRSVAVDPVNSGVPPRTTELPAGTAIVVTIAKLRTSDPGPSIWAV
ncbi:hypothetical protein D3C85_1710920 [compost metagenome]